VYIRLKQGKLWTHNRWAIPLQAGLVKTNAIALPMCVGEARNDAFSHKACSGDARWGVPELE